MLPALGALGRAYPIKEGFSVGQHKTRKSSSSCCTVSSVSGSILPNVRARACVWGEVASTMVDTVCNNERGL